VVTKKPSKKRRLHKKRETKKPLPFGAAKKRRYQHQDRTDNFKAGERQRRKGRGNRRKGRNSGRGFGFTADPARNIVRAKGKFKSRSMRQIPEQKKQSATAGKEPFELS